MLSEQHPNDPAEHYHEAKHKIYITTFYVLISSQRTARAIQSAIMSVDKCVQLNLAFKTLQT